MTDIIYDLNSKIKNLESQYSKFLKCVELHQGNDYFGTTIAKDILGNLFIEYYNNKKNNNKKNNNKKNNNIPQLTERNIAMLNSTKGYFDKCENVLQLIHSLFGGKKDVATEFNTFDKLQKLLNDDDANMKTLKNRLNKLALEVHPDKGASDNSYFHSHGIAKEMLLNTNIRNAYIAILKSFFEISESLQANYDSIENQIIINSKPSVGGDNYKFSTKMVGELIDNQKQDKNYQDREPTFTKTKVNINQNNSNSFSSNKSEYNNQPNKEEVVFNSLKKQLVDDNYKDSFKKEVQKASKNQYSEEVKKLLKHAATYHWEDVDFIKDLAKINGTIIEHLDGNMFNINDYKEIITNSIKNGEVKDYLTSEKYSKIRDYVEKNTISSDDEQKSSHNPSPNTSSKDIPSQSPAVVSFAKTIDSIGNGIKSAFNNVWSYFR